MQARKLKHPSAHPRGLRQQNHGFRDVLILNNSHVRQKWNEKKAFDQMKKKVELKWDELQA
jgi:hypothetical protein